MEPVPHSEHGLVRAFLSLYHGLLRKLTDLLGDYEDARDALQTAFLKCWRDRDGVAHVRNLRGWVWRVTLNTGRDLLRSGWRRRARPLEAAAGSPRLAGQTSPADALQEREEQEGMRVALENLRPEEREVFLLRQAGGRTWDEIARLRRAPVGTVKTQLRAAVRKLRAMLGAPGERGASAS